MFSHVNLWFEDIRDSEIKFLGNISIAVYLSHIVLLKIFH